MATSSGLILIAADEPIICAIYDNNINLLETSGWKIFKGASKIQKNMFRLASQSNIRSFQLAPTYKHGFQVPANVTMPRD